MAIRGGSARAGRALGVPRAARALARRQHPAHRWRRSRPPARRAAASAMRRTRRFLGRCDEARCYRRVLGVDPSGQDIAGASDGDARVALPVGACRPPPPAPVGRRLPGERVGGRVGATSLAGCLSRPPPRPGRRPRSELPFRSATTRARTGRSAYSKRVRRMGGRNLAMDRLGCQHGSVGTRRPVRARRTVGMVGELH
jgi:hypothetical protein